MSTYHHPEDLGPDQDQRDIAIPGRRFFVYVLDTDSGHYVGHTARLNARMREHRGGEVASTAGTNPMLAWQSGPMARRGDAARFEAALKSWLDSGSSMFEETTRLRPKKFLGLTPVLQSGTVRGVPSCAGRRFKLGADHRLRPTTAIGWLMFVAGIFGSLLGLLWAFNFELGALGVGALKVFGLAGACALGLVLVVNGRVLGRWPRLDGWLKPRTRARSARPGIRIPWPTARRTHPPVLSQGRPGPATIELSVMLRACRCSTTLVILVWRTCSTRLARRFVGLRLSGPLDDPELPPSAGRARVGTGLFEEINRHLESQGLRLQEGTIVDANH